MVNIFIFHAVFVFDTDVCVFDAVVCVFLFFLLSLSLTLLSVFLMLLYVSMSLLPLLLLLLLLLLLSSSLSLHLQLSLLKKLYFRCSYGVKKCTHLHVRRARGARLKRFSIILGKDHCQSCKDVKMLKIEKMMMVLLEMVTWPPLDRRPP